MFKAVSLICFEDGETKTAFISQAWLSHRNPDRRLVKWDLLKDIVRGVETGEVHFQAHRMMEMVFGKQIVTNKELQAVLVGAGWAGESGGGHVWWDYLCVPQEDTAQMALAIASIPYYIREASLFIVLAPMAVHEDGTDRDLRSWARRGWCRAERLVNALSTNRKPELVVESWSLYYISWARDWILNPVGLGDFTVDDDRRPFSLGGLKSAGWCHIHLLRSHPSFSASP